MRLESRRPARRADARTGWAARERREAREEGGARAGAAAAARCRRPVLVRVWSRVVAARLAAAIQRRVRGSGGAECGEGLRNVQVGRQVAAGAS